MTLLPPPVAPPAVVAPAAQSGVSAAFANTIVSTYPDGRTARLWLEPDGTYGAKGRRGDPSSGRWRVTGGRMCLKQSRPWPIPFTYCAPLVSGGVGTSWSGRAPTGEAIRITLAPGRSER